MPREGDSDAVGRQEVMCRGGSRPAPASANLPLISRSELTKDKTNSNRLKLLVVEDNQSVARMLRFSLRRAGFDVTEATTGEEALQILEHHPIGAVVLDLGLPDGLGSAVLDRLLQPEEQGYDFPAWVVISALDREEVVRRYGPLGGHFLAKPFDPWDLVRTLEDLLSGKEEPGQGRTL